MKHLHENVHLRYQHVLNNQSYLLSAVLHFFLKFRKIYMLIDPFTALKDLNQFQKLLSYSCKIFLYVHYIVHFSTSHKKFTIEVR